MQLKWGARPSRLHQSASRRLNRHAPTAHWKVNLSNAPRARRDAEHGRLDIFQSFVGQRTHRSPGGRIENSPPLKGPFQGWVRMMQGPSPEGTVDDSHNPWTRPAPPPRLRAFLWFSRAMPPRNGPSVFLSCVVINFRRFFVLNTPCEYELTYDIGAIQPSLRDLGSCCIQTRQ